jgi:hypothetical protein
LHNTGWGFGEIARLYELANLSGKPLAEIQDLRVAGAGWGEIEKTLGVKLGKGGGNLGSIISGHGITDTHPLTKTNGGVGSSTNNPSHVLSNSGQARGNPAQPQGNPGPPPSNPGRPQNNPGQPQNNGNHGKGMKP